MNFKDYQNKVKETIFYPEFGDNLTYPALGLTGEAGEVADKIKKMIRDHGGRLSPNLRQEIIKEMGDVMWYLAALCWELKIDLEEVAAKNVAKLQDRKQRNTLKGNGDNR